MASASTWRSGGLGGLACVRAQLRGHMHLQAQHPALGHPAAGPPAAMASLSHLDALVILPLQRLHQQVQAFLAGACWSHGLGARAAAPDAGQWLDAPTRTGNGCIIIIVIIWRSTAPASLQAATPTLWLIPHPKLDSGPLGESFNRSRARPTSVCTTTTSTAGSCCWLPCLHECIW